MTLKELEKFVNQLAAQHQSLQERVYALEKQRLRISFGVEATPEDLAKLKAASNDLHKSIYGGS